MKLPGEGPSELVSGVYRRGKIDLDHRVERPDGARVEVAPRAGEIRLCEKLCPDTPEGRAALVAYMNTLEPLELTPEDEAEIAAAFEESKKVTLEAVRRKMGL